MMHHLTWADFDAAVSVLARLVPSGTTGIHGVPRGGLPLAVALSHATGLPQVTVPRLGTVLVDEIADSGRTIAALRQHHGDLPALVWVKRCFTMGEVCAALTLPDDRWVVFPWERPEQADAEARRYAARQ